MLSVIIPTHNQAAELATLLATLVPGAVDGLVREVIVADAGSTDQTLEICEDAGAAVAPGGLVAASALAKSAWILVLPVDLRLQAEWLDLLKAHLSRGLRAAVLRGERGGGLFARFATSPSGLLIERAKLSDRPESRDVASLVRSLGGGAARL